MMNKRGNKMIAYAYLIIAIVCAVVGLCIFAKSHSKKYITKEVSETYSSNDANFLRLICALAKLIQASDNKK